jgi:hypothetical protein
MKTNSSNNPVGTTVSETNQDGSVTYTTVLSRDYYSVGVDLRLLIPIAVGVLILAVWMIRLLKRTKLAKK